MANIAIITTIGILNWINLNVIHVGNNNIIIILFLIGVFQAQNVLILFYMILGDKFNYKSLILLAINVILLILLRNNASIITYFII